MSEGRTRPGGLIDDRFLLKHQLGGGGAATVWCAQDLATREDVAIKLLHPRYRGIDEAHERLAREASLLASFGHPHIARARAFEFDRAQPYFVMTLIEGESLEDQLAARSAVDNFFTWPELLRLVQQICSAVDYAHARGVVHRDLKPSNIMLDRKAVPVDVRILDFGIAKLLGGVARNPTTQGRVMGTGFYMAPEQARGETLDPRADLFALGVIVFEMTTLRRAWVRSDRGGPVRAFAEAARRNEFNTPSAILSRIAYETRPRPSDFRAKLSPALDAAVTWALAIDPADRPPSANAFYEELVGAVGALEPPSDGFSTTAKGEKDARVGAQVDPTWSRVATSKSAEQQSLDLSTMEASAPTRTAAPIRAGGAAADPNVQRALAQSKAAADPADEASDPGGWHELGTLVSEHRSSKEVPAVAEPTQTAVDPAEGSPTVASPSFVSEAGAGAWQRTRLFAQPTAMLGGLSGTPSRATASFGDVPPALKVTVLVLGGLTIAALLLLAGYYLGRQTNTPLVIEAAVPQSPGRPSATARPQASTKVDRPAQAEGVKGQAGGTRADPDSQESSRRPVEGQSPSGSSVGHAPSGRSVGHAPSGRSVSGEASAPRRARRPRRRTAVVPDADAKSRSRRVSRRDRLLAPLRRMMDQARANPEDLALLTRLGRAIETRADEIRDPSERARVQRLASSSAMLGDTDGLGEAMRALESALGGG